MLRFLLICVIFQLTALPLEAQGKFRLPWKKQSISEIKAGTLGDGLSSWQISRQLDKRLYQTYLQAKQAQETLPLDHRVIIGEPVRKILSTQELKANELYPDQPFLKNNAQTGNYLAARNNRLFLQEVRRMKTVWAQIDAYLPRLKQEARNTPQPKYPMKWLSQIIPEETTQLFIGEAHGYKEIHHAVALLIQQLHARFAQREILVFTEFLPEEFTWSAYADSSTIPQIFHKYFSIWNQLLEEDIRVIGLEIPAAVDGDCVVRYLNNAGVLDTQTVWATLEGVRLRNERWQQTLTRYRAQYPDALFIVYAGADHVMYNRPFTLATRTTEKPFVSILYPNKYRALESSSRFFEASTPVAKPMRGPLERLVDQLDFQRPVVRWQSPDLPPIAGFDVRIKLPVKLEYIDY